MVVTKSPCQYAIIAPAGTKVPGVVPTMTCGPLCGYQQYEKANNNFTDPSRVYMSYTFFHKPLDYGTNFPICVLGGREDSPVWC